MPTYYTDTVQKNNQHLIYGTSYAIYNSKDYAYFQKALDHSCLVDSWRFKKIQPPYTPLQATGILDNTTVQYIDAFHDGAQGYFEEMLPLF
jgi:hypothetical protein